LVIGPGLDFAPRTELIDAFRPQSFQPYAVADAVLGLHLAQLGELRIDCVDINNRVIDFINRFPAGNRRLHLYSEPGVADYNEYFAGLGSFIGAAAPETQTPKLPPGFLERSIVVNNQVAAAIHAIRLNILTERLEQSYDLVIATNVLLYFNPNELSLALTNIAKMLRPGGCFVHNDLRPVTEADGDLLQMPPVAARSILIAHGRRAPLYDSFSICRKK
jgi:SAM-dependent methyltransferase